ncbi:Mitochondrial folate transporter/carrier [Schistosoma japonicum]|nr:Mitochondrial folate transporter/carrier [Schistosoma japonicum]KAH8849227.1 Mitochondrial folate transporter/carrier [Schistosoma japonicum]KAH8849229.1 Mitochondrial folate transporter/carrier [Schistosoma japonicum]KAH8849230.1 Mitochondrial folate transporter/carrier [Schistosoma japonicum]
MISILDKTQWQNLVAGVAGGVASVLILHPLDLAKVRLQVNEGTGVVAYRPKTTGTIRTLYEIVRSRGLRGLYLGLTPNAIGAGSSWGLYFCFYESLKKFAQHGDETKYLSSSQYLTFAALSGIVTLSIVNPIWVIKTRLCLQYEKGIKCTHKNSSVLVNSSQSTWHALYNLWMNEGFSGLYRGYVPGLFGVSHGAIQFLFYEHFKNLYNMYYRRTSVSEKLTAIEYLTFSSTSKLIAAVMTYPYQVVRSRMQDQHRKYNGVIDVIQQLWRGEGVHGFYKGLVPYVLRCMPSCGITFLVYEYSLMIFDWIK